MLVVKRIEWDWDFWNMSGSFTGTGCNAGRTINITGPSTGYRVQVGRGGNSQNCEFGLSTWFNGTENSNNVSADLYAQIDSACYYSMRPITNACINTLTNEEYDNGTTDWWIFSHNTNAATLNLDNSSQLSGVNSARIDITNTSGTDWHTQFAQSYKSIESGKTYTISFQAKAAANRNLNVVLQLGIDPWTPYFDQTLALTTSLDTYSLTFNSNNDISGDINLLFNVGESSETIWIDNVFFGEVCNSVEICGNGLDDDGDGDIDEADGDCFSCSSGLLTNPDFESGTTGWTFESNTTITSDAYFGSQAAHASGGVGGVSQSLAASPGQTYSLSVYAKQAAPEGANVAIKFFDSGGTELSSSYYANITSSTYELYTLSVMAPLGTAWVQALGWKNTGSGEAFWDGFCLEQWGITPETCTSSECDITPSWDNYIFALDDSGIQNNWLMFDDGGLVFCDNGDGTITIKGNVINGRDGDWDAHANLPCGAQDGWALDLLLSDMQSWTDFQGSYVQVAGCAARHVDWDYWDISGSLTGLGCNAGRPITILYPYSGYRMQIGSGGNSQSCNFGLSTWFTGSEGGNIINMDIYAHLDSTCYFSMRPPPASCENTVTNKEFNDGTTDWSVYLQSGNTAALSIDANFELSGINSGYVDISTASGTNWHVQVAQPGHSIEAGKNYNITFDAKAVVSRDIGLSLQRNDAPYTTYMWQDVSLTTIANTYSYDFQIDSTNVGLVTLLFNFGESADNVWIDNISFTEICNTEICNNGIDDDGDGQIDENDADCPGVINPTGNNSCNEQPFVFVPCYVDGDPLAGGTAAGMDAFVMIPYDSSGTQMVQGERILANFGEIGATWGVAIEASSKTIFTSAVLKRHVGLGSINNVNATTGGIYAFDDNLNLLKYIDVNTIGVNTGLDPRDGSPANSLTGNVGSPSFDVNAFDLVGKVGIGDIDYDVIHDVLWFINLNDRSLYGIKNADVTTTPTVSDILGPFPVSNPGCGSGANDVRPWGLGISNGKVYVGAVCSAETSQDSLELHAYVFEFDPVNPGSGMQSIFDFDLNYERGKVQYFLNEDGDWSAWQTANGVMTNMTYKHQPILSDIEFDDDGSMILGFMDRLGFQTGHDNYYPDVSMTNTSLIRTIAPGDVIRACFISGNYVLQGSGGCSLNQTCSADGRYCGPGGGEYYYGDFGGGGSNQFAESAMGALALLPNSGEVVFNQFDPFSPSFEGGLGWLNNTTGAANKRFRVYQGGSFGKAVGLGDIEIGCVNEICANNYDDDGDGLIDAADPDCPESCALTNPYPGFPIDFLNNNTGWIDYDLGNDLTIIDNGDGTKTISGSIDNGTPVDFGSGSNGSSCGATDGWTINLTLSDKMDWTTFQAAGSSANVNASCNGDIANLEYWDISGTLTGTGCNAGRTLTITAPKSPYRLQIGYGGNNGDNTCAYSMSTWFEINEGGTTLNADIYAFLDESCYLPNICSGTITTPCFDNSTGTVTDDRYWPNIGLSGDAANWSYAANDNQGNNWTHGASGGNLPHSYYRTDTYPITINITGDQNGCTQTFTITDPPSCSVACDNLAFTELTTVCVNDSMVTTINITNSDNTCWEAIRKIDGPDDPSNTNVVLLTAGQGDGNFVLPPVSITDVQSTSTPTNYTLWVHSIDCTDNSIVFHDCVHDVVINVPSCSNPEICDNGIDDDGDGLIDCDDTDCAFPVANAGIDVTCGGLNLASVDEIAVSGCCEEQVTAVRIYYECAESGGCVEVLDFAGTSLLNVNCGEAWTEGNVSLRYVTTRVEDGCPNECEIGVGAISAADGLWFTGGRVILDVSGIGGTITSVEIEFADYGCVPNTIRSFMYSGGILVDSDIQPNSNMLTLNNIEQIALSAVNPSPLMGMWVAMDGGTIVDENDPNSAVNGLAEGVCYTFEWTVDNGTCSSKGFG